MFAFVVVCSTAGTCFACLSLASCQSADRERLSAQCGPDLDIVLCPLREDSSGSRSPWLFWLLAFSYDWLKRQRSNAAGHDATSRTLAVILSLLRV